jgi:hypothetical protein
MAYDNLKGNTNAEKWSSILNNKSEFKSEKQYQDFIENNILLFCKDVLELGNYVSHKTNKSIQKNIFGGSIERADFIIKGTLKTAIVELKYPKNDFSELRNSISQCMHYIVVAENNHIEYDKICIVSPVLDKRMFDIIKRFNLPIELYYLTRNNHSKIEIK